MKRIIALTTLFFLVFSMNVFAQTWTAQTSGVTTSLNCVSAVDANIGWIGGNGGVILKTTNGGANWVSVANATVGTNDIYAICAISASVAFVSTSPAATYVFRTSDGGTTWTQVFTQTGGFIDDIKFKDANTGFMYGDPVSARWSLWKTTNAGVTWDSTGCYLPQAASEAGWNNAMWMVGNTIWFGTNSTKVYKSTNFGATGSWTSGATTGSANSYSVAFNGNTGFTGQTIALKSTDGGSTYATATLPGTGTCYSFNTITGTNKFWVNRGASIYYSSDNGTTWASQFTGTGTYQAMSMVLAGTTIRGWSVTAAGLIAMYNDTYTPPTPTYVYPTLGCNYGAMPLYSSGAFGHSACVLNDTLYVTGGSSTGAGSTTSQRYAVNSNTFSTGTALPESKAGHSMVKCGNAIYLIGGSSSVTVGGTTNYKYTPSTGWTSIAPLPVALSGHVAVNWGDSVIFVIGGPWSAPSTTVYFYRPADNTWGTSTACLAGRRSAAVGIIGNKIIIAAGYNAAFFKNTQVGTIGSNASTITWAAGPDVPLPTGVTGSSRPGGTGVGSKFYFVPGEMSGGLSNTSDSIRVFDGTAWESTLIYGRGVSGSASNYWAAVTNYVAGSGKVKVLITGGALGTVFPGLCTAQVDACSVTNVGPIETPVNYNLSQNYPNPFNPTTKINYALPKSGYVTLKVYDVLGKEVATLVNEAKNAGNYSVEFNASNLSSGMYFYKIDVNGFSEVKRMMLVK